MNGLFECKDVSRFFNKVIQIDNCWMYMGNRVNGYGRFFFNGKMRKAHRFSYELFKGNIPKELTLDHLCRNRACVNPTHLEAVTMKENNLRGKGCCAINARKTHCIRGHPLSGDNLYIQPSGSRNCKICKHRVVIKNI